MDNEFYLSIGGISPEVSLEQAVCRYGEGTASIKHFCKIERWQFYSNFVLKYRHIANTRTVIANGTATVPIPD